MWEIGAVIEPNGDVKVSDCRGNPPVVTLGRLARGEYLGMGSGRSHPDIWWDAG